MTSQGTIITLSIRDTGTSKQPAFLFNVLVDEALLASNQSLSTEESQTVIALSRQYNALFEQHYAPNLAADSLKAIGAELFNLWLARVWDKVKEKIPSGALRLLVIASDAADVLNLPWELLRPTDGDHIGFDPKFSIRRSPWPNRPLAQFDGVLRPRPLRVLFMACAPKDQDPLDYEREEESLLRIIARVGPNVAFDSGDLGTFDELRDRINEFEPHIVHLTGHGTVLDDGLGYFCFEDESGLTDARSSVELGKLLAGSSVQCSFISGCQTGKAPQITKLGGICQGLVSEEVPMAIGWAASIADNIATEFAFNFYKTLALGQPVNRALGQARQSIARKCEEMGYPAWTLPVLYAATTQERLFDPDPSRPEERPPRSSTSQMQHALPGIGGYTEHFVGRRREIQRLLPLLREGTQQVVILTGIGGAGKSTLATRLTRKLETFGFTPIPIPSPSETPLSAARLLQSCGQAFLDAGLRKDYDILRDAGLPVMDRLRHIVTALNRNRFVLVLDNFEVNIDETTRNILDKDLADFYGHLLNNLIGGSRAIITSRYLPSNIPTLPKTAHEEALGDFPESAFFKFMLRDPVVEDRYFKGVLPHKLLSELYRLLGGTPRFLGQMREVLKTITTEELEQALKTIELPDAPESKAFREARNSYCEQIFTARLYGYLSAESQLALSRAAVYGVPVNMDALAAVTGESHERLREFTRQWRSYAMAYTERERADAELWTIYGLLRGWLLAPERLSTEECRASHQAGGQFLRNLVEQKREGELGLSWIDCLLEARSQFIAAGDYDEARKVTGRISEFLTHQGLYDELLRINLELLTYENHPSQMIWIGRSYSDRGDYVTAREWYQRGLQVAGDEVSTEAAMALHQLATIDIYIGEYDVAREKFLKSLEISQQIGNRAGEANTWHQLATIDVYVGEYDVAREKFLKSLEISQQIGDRAGEADTWHNLATIDIYIGEYDVAREKFLKSLEINQQIGDRAGEATIWHNLASIDLNIGDYDASREKFLKSLEIKQQIGNRAGEAVTWHQLATIDLYVGEYDAAREKFLKSLGINQQIGNRTTEAATFYQLGMLAAQSGRLLEGTQLVALCFLIDKSIGHGDTESDARALASLASQLNYSEEQLKMLLQQVTEEYQTDRGAGLLKAAFGEV
jgi:tetratricopeptide (TPR) repeat protein